MKGILGLIPEAEQTLTRRPEQGTTTSKHLVEWAENNCPFVYDTFVLVHFPVSESSGVCIVMITHLKSIGLRGPNTPLGTWLGLGWLGTSGWDKGSHKFGYAVDFGGVYSEFG